MEWNATDRFIVVYKQIRGFSDTAYRVLVDRVTGVNYLCVAWGHGTGLTPLLDANGKPIVTPVENL